MLDKRRGNPLAFVLVRQTTFRAFVFGAAAVFALSLAPSPAAGQAPDGKLIVFGDLAAFNGPGTPENCFLKNRFKKGQNVGFRITAVDGATGEPEKTAEVVVHLAYGGRTVDVPARYRGVAGNGPVYPNMWSAKWVVPQDAPTGVIRYTVTAKDAKGRSASFTPFVNEASQLTVVE